jgi:hypothetical protein
MEKVPPIDNPKLHMTLLVLSLSIIGITLLWWPIVYLIRREHKPAGGRQLSFFHKLIPYLAGLLLIVFLVSLAAGDPMGIVYGISPFIKTILVLPLIAGVFSLATLILAFRVLPHRQYAWPGKVHYLLLTLALLTLLWQLYHWNMLGFNY